MAVIAVATLSTMCTWGAASEAKNAAASEDTCMGRGAEVPRRSEHIACWAVPTLMGKKPS